MDRTTSMATFVRVVDAGSFASAGRALGMSPSTVTEHVHALEARLGVRLLNRNTRKISLTEVGGTYTSVASKSWRTSTRQIASRMRCTRRLVGRCA